jgi:hypothetical protein
MRKRMLILCCAVFAVGLVRALSDVLRPRSVHPMVSAMPGAAILGFYAAAVANFLAMAIWHARVRRSWVSLLTRHSLLLLAVAGFCLDYVFNNYREITTEKERLLWSCRADRFFDMGISLVCLQPVFPKGRQGL